MCGVFVCTYTFCLFVASVSSLISGSPFNDINVNDIAGSYTGIFSTSIDGDLTGPGQQVSKYVCIYLKPSYFSSTLILIILVRGLVITKFNTC